MPHGFFSRKKRVEGFSDLGKIILSERIRKVLEDFFALKAGKFSQESCLDPVLGLLYKTGLNNVYGITAFIGDGQFDDGFKLKINPNRLETFKAFLNAPTFEDKSKRLKEDMANYVSNSLHERQLLTDNKLDSAFQAVFKAIHDATYQKILIPYREKKFRHRLSDDYAYSYRKPKLWEKELAEHLKLLSELPSLMTAQTLVVLDFEKAIKAYQVSDTEHFKQYLLSGLKYLRGLESLTTEVIESLVSQTLATLENSSDDQSLSDCSYTVLV